MSYNHLLIIAVMLSGCAIAPPSNVADVCAIFRQQNGWYEAAEKSRSRWRSPIPVMMAIIHQESRFQARVKPPRKKILWLIPGPRPSSSYGYTQALDETWDSYRRATGRRGADRDNFSDAIDFVGWYNDQSRRLSSIKRDDPYHLYLAYHEGHGGFNRRSFKRKQWLKDVAKKVSRQTLRYGRQLESCADKLDDGGGWFR